MITVKRIHSIDIVRGIVMIIMALDHVRDLLHVTALTQNPTDLTTTTPLLFFTRWITHLCAPTFVFLSGASAYLTNKKNQNSGGTGKLLWKRGLWLIILEFTLINFALWFDFHFRILMLQVIAAIGTGLIVLAALVKVHPKKTGIIALIIIFGHNLLQYLPIPDNKLLNALTNVLFRPGIMFILLSVSGKLPVILQSIFTVYGKVPLFYYLLHFYFIRLAVFIMVYAQGFVWKDLLFGPFQLGRPAKGSGINLGLIYIVWVLLVLLLYPLCRWYGNYKEQNYTSKWWLKYV